MHPSSIGFACCLTIAFFSDVFDGVIARRLGIATPTLRRLDSVADSLFYAAALFAAWYLHPRALRPHLVLLGILLLLEATRYTYDFWKFRREASYHMWSSKLWGIALFAAFFSVLVGGVGQFWIVFALITGIVADVEGLAISILLNECRTDIPSFIHALRKARQK